MGNRKNGRLVVARNFTGFTVPEGSYFPPELRQLLPYLDTRSEILVLFVILDSYFQSGLDAMPLTVDTIQERTGLSRPSVIEGLKRLSEPPPLVRRLAAGNTYAYEPLINRASKETLLPCMHDIYTNHGKDSLPSEDEKHACNERNFTAERNLTEMVQSFGVATRVAVDLVNRFDAERIQRQLNYTRYEIEAGFQPRNVAGFVVARIRDDRPMPLGFEEPGGKRNVWFTDEEAAIAAADVARKLAEMEGRA
jgi:hypothetical protein